jgi:hypothetical protein
LAATPGEQIHLSAEARLPVGRSSSYTKYWSSVYPTRPIQSLVSTLGPGELHSHSSWRNTYTIYGCLAASLSAAVIQYYGLNNLTAGLTYLPNGIGVIVASYTTGKLLDHDYRLTAQKLGLDQKSQTNGDFPFAKARLRSIFPVIVVSSVTTARYGWIIETKTHIAALLVVEFFSGAAQVCIFATCGTLLTNLNPGRSSTVHASYNLVRCALSGAGVAVLKTMIAEIGYGWTFTIFAALGLLDIPLLLFLTKKRTS